MYDQSQSTSTAAHSIAQNIDNLSSNNHEIHENVGNMRKLSGEMSSLMQE